MWLSFSFVRSFSLCVASDLNLQATAHWGNNLSHSEVAQRPKHFGDERTACLIQLDMLNKSNDSCANTTRNYTLTTSEGVTWLGMGSQNSNLKPDISQNYCTTIQ